ncbi:MAG: phosphonate metabolism protein/1,5-bisphosphokinase (PRPP-forming) PhnN [Paracoccaceae bacterium]
MKQGRLICCIGPSGVGKDAVMGELCKKLSYLSLVKRVITRPKTAGGEDHFSVSEVEFEAMRRRGEFALHWDAHGLRYGIPNALKHELSQGQDRLVNLSRSSLGSAMEVFPSLQVIVLSANLQTLRDRLVARGRETSIEIEARLSRKTDPLPKALRYWEVDNSGLLTETVEEITNLLNEVEHNLGYQYE